MKNSLRYFRKRLNLTQKALGAAIGLTHTTVSAYEVSEEALPIEFLDKVSRVLGTTAEEIQSPPVESLKEDAPLSRGVSVDLTVMTEEWLNKLQDYYTQESRRADIEADLRSRCLDSLKNILDEQQRRILNSKPLGADEERALANAGEAQRLAQESAPKQKAAGTSGDKPGPTGGAAKGTK